MLPFLLAAAEAPAPAPLPLPAPAVLEGPLEPAIPMYPVIRRARSPAALLIGASILAAGGTIVWAALPQHGHPADPALVQVHARW